MRSVVPPLACLALMLGQALAQTVPTPHPAVQDFSQVFSDVAEKALPSVVTILARHPVDPSSGGESEEGTSEESLTNSAPTAAQSFEQALGSGIIVREDGLIVTNHHVIEKAETIRVRLHDRRELPAKVVGTDPQSDLAVVRVDARNLPYGRFGSSDVLRVGEWVLCIGSPLSEALDHTVTAGIVSAKGRSNVGLTDYEDYIQTDAAINPGNSGGPMLNLRGEIVGINTAIATETGGYQGVGFAVPSRMVQSILQQLLEHGKVTRGWVGLTVQNFDEVLIEAVGLPIRQGVLVGDLVEDSPAAIAGAKVGDVLLSIDGRRVDDVTEVRNRIAAAKPLSKLELEIWRAGKKLLLSVVVAELTQEDVEVPEPSGAFRDLGLSVQSLEALSDEPQEAAGLVVIEVAAGGIASGMGLRVGDVLRTANKQPLGTEADLVQILGKLRPGAPVLLYVERDGGTLFYAFKKPA